MIIVHFFVREEKRGKRTLKYESTATEGLKPLAPGVEDAFVISPATTPQKVVEKAKACILAEHPELEFVDILKNIEGDRPMAFDLTFRPRKSWLNKLGIT